MVPRSSMLKAKWGEGRRDIVAAERATKNLKVYWNRPAEE